MATSPMMQQYEAAKAAAGDALLLFRMGDFYELFHDDAKLAAKLLGLSLTSRDKGDNPIPMAGFPHHQLEQYLAKIVAAGHRAAICDQVEDAKQAKGLVKRDITRVVSRGTLTDDALLDPQAHNFLAAVMFVGEDDDRVGLGWVDISTGRFAATVVDARSAHDLMTRIDAAEILVADDARPLPAAWTEGRTVTKRPKWDFAPREAARKLAEQFGTQSLEGFGFDGGEAADDAPAVTAAAAIVEYLKETQKTSLEHIDGLTPLAAGTAMEIDAATWRSLEVTQTLRDGRRDGALLGILDRTVTSMGARLLAEWLAYPLVDREAIESRLDAVQELVDQVKLAAAVRDTLASIYDIQRLVARVTTGRAGPRDLLFLARTLAALPALKAKLAGRQSALLTSCDERIDLCADVRGRLEKMLADDCPLHARDGGFIREGADPRLDEFRQLMAGGKQWMANYQAAEIERTGIPAIKVGYNRVFGYYLEITHTHRDRVPPEYHRKQTLKNAERYITPELKEYEEKVLSAEERAVELELQLFDELRQLAASARARLMTTAAALAELDVLAGLAEVSRSRGYVRPEIATDGRLEIEAGRHPVVEATEPAGTFVPNDTICAARDGDDDSESLLLVTGPNMAGKSTYIRQTALLVLMSQIGSFVPARRAVVGIADKLFARVGASDELSRGQSTFMVEMTEAARILNTATPRSLVVLDEIGRGTSTYDGLSLAWSIVEYLHERIGCRTLFATHYHELTELADRLPGVGCRNVMVREHFGNIVFLHQIVAGAADRSYGIHVARLAGVPGDVSARAEEILADLEQHGHSQPPSAVSAPKTNGQSTGTSLQLTLFATEDHPLIEEIRKTDVDQLRPVEALSLLAKWREQLGNE